MVEQPHDERCTRAASRRRRTSVVRACVRGLTFSGLAVTAWLLGAQAAQADTGGPAPEQPISVSGVVGVVDSQVPRLLPQGQLIGDPLSPPTTCHESTLSSPCPDPAAVGQDPPADAAPGDSPADPTPAAGDRTGGGHHTSVADQPSGVLPPAGSSGAAAPVAEPSTRLSAELLGPVAETGRSLLAASPAPAGAAPAGSTDALATVVHYVTSPLSRLPLGEVTGPVTGALAGTTRRVGDTLIPAVPILRPLPQRPVGRHPAEPGPFQPAEPPAAPRIGASTGGETSVLPSMSGTSAERRQVDYRGTAPEVPTYPAPAPFLAYLGAGLSNGGLAGGGPTSHSEAGANATVGVIAASDASVSRVPAVTARLGVLPKHAEDPAVSPD